MFGTNTFAQSAFAATGGLYLVTQVEVAVPTDAQGNTLTALAGQSETQTPTDSSASILQYNVAQAETTATSEAAQAQLTALASQSETTAISDAVANYLQAVASQSEIAVASEALQAQLTAVASQSEAQTPTDTVSPILQYNVSRVETALASDAYTNYITLLAAQFEAAAATDTQSFTVDTTGIVVGIPITIALGFPLVWGLVDVEQDAQWAEVVPVFRVAEIATFGGMSFGGAPYAGSLAETFIVEAAKWTQIDGEESTLWAEVVT